MANTPASFHAKAPPASAGDKLAAPTTVAGSSRANAIKDGSQFRPSSQVLRTRPRNSSSARHRRQRTVPDDRPSRRAISAAVSPWK